MRQFITQGGVGSIVNIASINAFKPQPNMPAYTSAKHALVGLTKHASMEGGPHNIRINAVAPGAIIVSYAHQLSTNLSFSGLLTSPELTDCHG
jgi:glucose 1-dehydrogenase